MEIYRSYKYLLKPTEIQKIKIKEILERVTYVHNRFVDDFLDGKNTNVKAKNILMKYKEEKKELQDTDGSALINEIFKLQDRREKIQKKKRCTSYTTSNLYRQSVEILSASTIYIPKVGAVKFSYYRSIPCGSEIVNSTISIDNLRNYYICLNVKFNKLHNEKKLNQENSIGLDYSTPHFYVDNKGRKIDMPHFRTLEEKKIADLNRKLEKCEKGSENYKKIKNKIAKKYKRISNQRKDFLHKLSTQLANEYDYVFVEDLNIQEIINGKYNLQKQTYDNSFSLFLQYLDYKMKDRDKKLIKIGRYFPSSKMCNICGYVNKDLKLSNRIWICPGCKTKLNRDENSAINIRNEGIRIVNIP